MVAPSTAWKLPAAHRLHRALAGPEELPGLQKVGATAPIGQKAPGGQMVQSDGAELPVAFE